VFLRYFDFVFAPFRAVYNKWIDIKNVQGNIKVDINRSKALAQRGKNFAGQAQQFQQKHGGEGQQGQQPQGQQPQGQPPPQQAYGQPPQQGWPQQGAYMQQQPPGYPPPGMPPGPPGMPPPGMPGMPPPPGMPSSAPAIRSTGFWFWKKKFCTQCEQQLDKSWDACPYCQQIAAQAAAAPAKLQALKTQAFVLDQSGGPGSMQLLGWIIPLQGPQKGELFTLQPTTIIGTDPKCNIVLQDKFMSSKHAEIKAENGMWVLRDSGSTNGTYVNNKRIDRHELVDNDFVKFGSAMLKFKSL
jgi:hypothetical protein